MDLAERRGELIVGGGFVCARCCGASRLAGSARADASSLTADRLAALYVVGLAAAGHIRIDVGSGFTVPTQAVFVPLLFAVPLPLVPLLVALALALGMPPAVLARPHLAEPPADGARQQLVRARAGARAAARATNQPPTARRSLGVLLLALLAQFACDFTANAARERLCGGHRDPRARRGGARGLPDRPRARPARAAVALAAAQPPLGGAADRPALRDPAALLQGAARRLEQLIELGDAYRGTALVLGDVVEADDAYTGEHCKGVVRLALDVAEASWGSTPTARATSSSARCCTTSARSRCPRRSSTSPASSTSDEWEIIKTHTIEGQRMLERVGGFMREVGEIVRSSHERWDGAGYPDGLRGAAIPLEARIVSACDAFNAMTTTRSYRKAMRTRGRARRAHAQRRHPVRPAGRRRGRAVLDRGCRIASDSDPSARRAAVAGRLRAAAIVSRPASVQIT